LQSVFAAGSVPGMRMAFLAKYRESGLLLMRVGLGVLFIILTGPVLLNPGVPGNNGVGTTESCRRFPALCLPYPKKKRRRRSR
jgi:hypothetical protein